MSIDRINLGMANVQSSVRFIQCAITPVFAILFTLFSMDQAAHAAVIDSVNAGKTPDAGTFQAVEVGWFYTPSFSYSLTGIEARFGFPGDFSGLSTVEIYSNHPGSRGTLLRRSDFFPVQDAYAGGIFEPLSLIAGKSYFIGFRNISGESLIYTSGPGAQVLSPGIYFGFTDEGLYAVGPATGLGYESPILQFTGELNQGTVPEPSTMVIFALATGAFSFKLKRLRRV